jgi:hypothetical protein
MKKVALVNQQIALGVVGDRQRITVLTIPEQELALVVGASEIVGTLPQAESRGLSSPLEGRYQTKGILA